MKTTDPSIKTIPENEVVDTRAGTFIALSRHPIMFLDKPVYDEFFRYAPETFQSAFGIGVPETAEAKSIASILAEAEARGLKDRAGHMARIAWRSSDGRIIEAV